MAKKFSDVCNDIDAWIALSVFQPVANKIDHHFGINPYRVAIYILTASAVVAILDFTENTKQSWFLYFIYIVIMPMCRWWDITRLEKISAAYERALLTPSRSMHMPIEWTFFHSKIIRLGNVVLWIVVLPGDIRTVVLAPHWWQGAIFMVSQTWIILVAIGFYFGGCFPPFGGRKEKKQKHFDWTFGLMPQRVKS